jgi:hypothetical protein
MYKFILHDPIPGIFLAVQDKAGRYNYNLNLVISLCTSYISTIKHEFSQNLHFFLILSLLNYAMNLYELCGTKRCLHLQSLLRHPPMVRAAAVSFTASYNYLAVTLKLPLAAIVNITVALKLSCPS